MFDIARLRNLTHSCTNLEQNLILQNGTGTRRILLKGTLVDHCRLHTENRVKAAPMQLFLKDQVSYIGCIVPSKTRWMLGQEVLCTKWNLIVTGKEKCLELVDFTPCGPQRSDVLSVNRNIQGLITVTTAVKLWQIRKCLQIKELCLRGRLTCLTEITRYKGAMFFIIKLEDDESTLNILIQDQRFHWWQQVLVVEESYVFTDLVPTSVKCSAEDCVLYVPTATSLFHVAKDIDQDTLLIDYESFVKGRCIDLETGTDQCEKLLHHVFTSFTKQPKPPSVCTYKGQITDTSQKDLGIFELDHKIRLYVAGSKPVHNYDFLREGMAVTVYNAHHKGHPKPPKIRLCCCEWSCVKVEKIPVFELKEQKEKVNTAVSDLRKHMYSLHHLEWLMDAQEKITEKLAPGIVRHPSVSFLLEKVLSLVSSEISQPIPDRLSSLLASHDDSCFVMNKQIGTFPRCITMKELCTLAKQFQPEAQSNASIEPASAQAAMGMHGDKFGWKIVQKGNDTLRGNPVLIGQLKANKKTANLQLVDQTGSVDSVICRTTLVPTDYFTKSELINTENSDENTLQKHKCQCLQPYCVQNSRELHGTETDGLASNKTCSSKSWETRKLPCTNSNSKCCDFAHIEDLGELFLVKTFTLMVEEYISVGPSSTDSLFGTGNSLSSADNYCDKLQRCYVQFSMQDAVRLSTHDKKFDSNKVKKKDNIKSTETKNNQNGHHSDNRRESCTAKRKIDSSEDVTKANNMHREKKYRLEANEGHTNSKLTLIPSQSDFDTNMPSTSGSLVHSGTVQNANTATLSVCQPFILLHKDSLQVKSQTSGQPKLVFYALVCFLGKAYILPSSGETNNSSQSTGTSKKEGFDRECSSGSLREVALVFEESSVKWYHVVHVGHVYVLCREKCRDVGVFQPKCASQGLKRALLKSGSRMLLSVDEAVIVQEYIMGSIAQVQEALKLAVDMVKENKLLPQVFTIGQLRLLDFEERLVSVCGVITKRRHIDKNQETRGQKYTQRCVSKEMHKLGVVIPDNCTVELTLMGTDTDGTLRVFVNPDTQPHPLGLLCGSQVLLYKVELKQSASGSLYCQYRTASSCRLIATLGSAWENCNHNTTDHQRSSGTISHICDLLYGNVGGVLTVFPTIQRVLKVSMKHLCTKCSRLGTSTEGERTACSCGSSHFVMNSQLSVLLDDGTSNAIMYCYGDNVWKLLHLNRQQQTAVEELVARQGALILNQDNNGDASPASLYMKLLVSSNMIKRRVSLEVRRRGQNFGTMNKPYAQLTLNDVPMKRICVGDVDLHSHSLPLIQLDCVTVSEINPTAMAKLLLYSAKT